MEEDPSLLKSSYRPLCSADELVGEAGRFRETMPDGAGKDDPPCAAQVDQVTDTDEMGKPCDYWQFARTGTSTAAIGAPLGSSGYANDVRAPRPPRA